jgi:hypothetical protein
MPETGLLIGPLRLSEDAVDHVVTGTLPGAFALGRMRSGSFVVNYVGRSDANLRADLLAHARAGKYKLMRFDYCAGAEDAFARECAIYHDFGESRLLDNKAHPKPPEGGDLRCPKCGK